MKTLNKKRINTVFGAYVSALIIGAITVNALSGDVILKMPFTASKSDMEKFSCKVESLMESRLNNVKVEHADITGLKGITRKRRNQSLETINNNNTPAAAASFASYKAQPMPEIPVEFLGELNDEKRAEIRSKVPGLASKFIGSPYVFGGKGPKAFDCSGFTAYIMRQFGIMVSPGAVYQALQGRHVDLDKAKPGDMLYFSAYGRGGVITHVGLIVENNAEGITIIHATTYRYGVIKENVTKSPYWRNKILFARDMISGDTRPARP
jgi:cell wall-associated NlpC family hydrolase